MSSKAIVGTGTTLWFSAWDSEDIVVLDVSPPKYSRDKISTTHMGTRTQDQIEGGLPGFATSLPSALITPGEATFEIAFKPEKGIPPVGIQQFIKITFPNNTYWAFKGFVNKYTPKVPLEDRMTASVTLQASGILYEDEMPPDYDPS